MGCWGWRPIKDGYAPGMRQALLYPRIRKTLNTLDLGSGVRGGAPSMRPLLPFLIATFLCWSPDLTGTRPDLEQGYATRVCAGDETPLGLPRRPSTKTRYAPGMRWPHSFAAHLDPAGSRPGSGQNPSGARVCVKDMRWDETPLDLPRRLSTKNKYALGMRRPHSSLAIWIQLEHGLDLAAFHLEFSLSDDCSPESKTVSHKDVASSRIVPKRLLH